MKKQNTYRVNKNRFRGLILFSLLLFQHPVLLHSQVSEFNFATGNVKGRNFVGGLFGRVADNAGKATNSFARGSVTGEIHVGGFAGSNNGIVENSYSTGKVTAGSSKGGLIGSGAGTASSSYWDMQTSLLSTSASGMGKNTSAMVYPYTSGTYTGWDFNAIWKNDQAPLQNNGYPLLVSANVYLLEIRVFPAGSGTVSGAGYYRTSQQARVSATAGQSFEFKGWVKNSETVSTQPIYNLPLSANTNLVALFQSKTTGTDENLSGALSSLKIYPNPVKDMLWIDVSGLAESMKSFSVINLNGQVVKICNANGSESRTSINVSDLTPGIYLFRADFEKVSGLMKFVKY